MSNSISRNTKVTTKPSVFEIAGRIGTASVTAGFVLTATAWVLQSVTSYYPPTTSLYYPATLFTILGGTALAGVVEGLKGLSEG